MTPPEPPIPYENFNHFRTFFKRMYLALMARILSSQNIMLAMQNSYTAEQVQEGKIWPGYADTLIGLKRLDNLQVCVETAIKEGIERDLIETGVWRGGACIFMRAILAAHDIEDRKVYVADSF